MLKWFNKNKEKKNKGFTLVELIIVVAILAILVGLLAPQYTKYVERSRQAADASNLDNLVTAIKVATADGAYDITPATYTIAITADETTVVSSNATAGLGDLEDALKEYAGEDWDATTLKSSKWGKPDGVTVNADNYIAATCKVEDTGAVTVQYFPDNVKNSVSEKKATDNNNNNNNDNASKEGSDKR